MVNESLNRAVTSPNKVTGQATEGKTDTVIVQVDEVAENGPFITKSVKVNTPAVSAVPVTKPDDESSVRPEGSSPDRTDIVKGVWTVVVESEEKDNRVSATIAVGHCTVRVLVTSIWHKVEAVAPPLSVTNTVNMLSWVVAGVPLTTPVALNKTRPFGTAPDKEKAYPIPDPPVATTEELKKTLNVANAVGQTIVGAATTEIEQVGDTTVAAAVSSSWPWNEYKPVVVGVPDKVCVAALNDSPGGTWDPATKIKLAIGAPPVTTNAEE
jgi:hypothetical protein